MSELISGKEAFNAALDGKGVLWRHINNDLWLEWSKHTAWCIEALECNSYQFKLKPKTITVNNIEVPAPFEPKEGERYFYLWDCKDGYGSSILYNEDPVIIAAWRTEDEIKQVVAALRKIFVINNQ